MKNEIAVWLLAALLSVCAGCRAGALGDATASVATTGSVQTPDAPALRVQTTTTPRPSTSQTTAQTHTTSGRNTTADHSLPASHQIAGVTPLLQTPELPTGCEITALTMLLHYSGLTVDKTTLARDYLPTTVWKTTVGKDGKTYGPDLNRYFVGDPFSYDGLICGTEAIVTAANRYLQDAESRLRAKDVTGLSFDELYRRVSQDQPVLVWVTIEMADRWETQGWYTTDGTWVEWSQNDHGAVLTGYTKDTVTICDPISGLIRYDRAQFEQVFASRGYACVVLE